MSDTGKQSPLGVNVLGTLLQNEGFYINPKVRDLAGDSKYNDDYAPGEIVTNTCLKWLTYAINDAYKRGEASGNASPTVNSATYDAILAIGQSRIPALGNGNPPTYLAEDPSNQWNGEATTSYGIPGDGSEPATPYDPPVPTEFLGQGQDATWYPYTTENPNVSVTQWGWLRLIALQAWNEFNYNGLTPGEDTPEYRYFLQSMLAYQGFCEYSNKAIFAINDSKDFLKGIYSNMDDLTSSDITGVSLANRAFGQDLINLGKALDLSLIAKYGLPSALLQTLQKNNAITQNLNLALLSSGLSSSEIETISNNPNITVSREQEQKLYGAFLAVNGVSLLDILNTLNCKTKNLSSLADLLSVKKIFPTSYRTLTVPIYNTEPGPTNSKTYYLLFINDELNPQLVIPRVKEIVGTIVPPTEPPVVIEEPVLPPIEPVIEPIIPVPPPPTPAVISGGSPPPTTVPTGGGGGGGGGGGCVVLDAYVPTVETRTHNGKIVEKAWQLEPTFDILLADEELKSSKGKIVKAMIDFQPCVKIITASGIRLSCSTTAPILTKNKGYVEAPKLFGEQIAVMRNDIAFWDEVVSIDDIGYKHVRVIDTGDNSFWAGDIQNAYVLHHNARIEDALDYDKK